MWQDWAIMIVQVVFAISLFPTILHPTQKPTLLTGILTTSSIVLMGITYASLSLWLATLLAGINATLWAIIAYQRYRLNRNSSSRINEYTQ